MAKEPYIFVLWQNARFMEKNIINDIKKSFEIFQSYEITWSPEFFANNLARFYGKKLPKGCKKEKEVGCGPFLVLFVYDNNPKYNKNGQNTNTIKAKHQYRQMLGANLIYASDTPFETTENLLMLFGKNIADLEKEPQSTPTIAHSGNVVGCPGWLSIDEAIEIAKKVPFTHITPYKKSYIIHTRHADLIRRLLNAQSHFKIPGRHKYFIKVNKTKYPIYIRKVS